MQINSEGQYKVVDNNFAQRAGMEAYLTASDRNHAVLPDTVLIEWHRKKGMATARHALQIACRFPAQILILKETVDQFSRVMSNGDIAKHMMTCSRATISQPIAKRSSWRPSAPTWRPDLRSMSAFPMPISMVSRMKA